MKRRGVRFWMYVEPLNDARTKLGTGFDILERELVGGANQPKRRRTRLRARIFEREVGDSALPS